MRDLQKRNVDGKQTKAALTFGGICHYYPSSSNNDLQHLYDNCFFSLFCCKIWRICVPVCNQDWRNQQLLYYSIVFYNSSIPITVFTIIWVFLWLVKCLMETHWTIDTSIIPEHVNNLDDSSFFNGRSTKGRAQNGRIKIHVFKSVSVSLLKTQQKVQRQGW